MRITLGLILAALLLPAEDAGKLYYEWKGAADDDLYGEVVSNARDVDNDSFSDVIVGQPGADEQRGRATVYEGQEGEVVHTFEGEAAGDRYGFSVSDAGDVNGDAYDDLIVGAPGANGGAGAAYVISGKDGEPLYTYAGENPGDEFGFSVSAAGDANGDSYDDVVVGAPGYDTKKADDAGHIVVYSGKDGEVLFEADGDRAGDKFGFSVANAGDTNSDSFDEVVVGAPFAGKKRKAVTGGAYVFHVKKRKLAYKFYGEDDGDHFGWAVHGAGDANADGADDVIVGTRVKPGYARLYSGRKGKELHTFEGSDSDTFFGASVGGFIDFDADGFSEVVIGGPIDRTARGKTDLPAALVQVFSGKTHGVLLTLNGESGDDNFGSTVSGAGDVNSDGFGDLVLGDDYHGSRPGRVRVHLGKAE